MLPRRGCATVRTTSLQNAQAMTTFTAYIEFDEETRLYVAIVPGRARRAQPGAEPGRAARQSHGSAGALPGGAGRAPRAAAQVRRGAADQGRLSGAPPPVDPRVMDRALRKLGFARVRQRGSHVFYRHPDGRTTTMPQSQGARPSRAPGTCDPRRHPPLAGRFPAPPRLVAQPCPVRLRWRSQKPRNPPGFRFVRIRCRAGSRVRSCRGAARVRSDFRGAPAATGLV
jgi:predicted RNA binding protein YcfA (HicA-like mRNA interferase family)